MTTVSVLLTLHLHGVQSLNEKRAVVRSLVARLRSRLDLTAAEVGSQDVLQRAEIGFAVVSEDFTNAHHLADEAMRFADAELLGKAEVVNREVAETVLEGSRH